MTENGISDVIFAQEIKGNVIPFAVHTKSTVDLATS